MAFYHKKTNFLVVGAQSSGKSSLVNRFVLDTFEKTSDCPSNIFQKKWSYPVFGDVRNIQSKIKECLSESSLETELNYFDKNEQTIILVCCDLSDQPSFQQAMVIINKLHYYISNIKKEYHIVLIGTKCDLVTPMFSKDILNYCQYTKLPFYRTSAKDNTVYWWDDLFKKWFENDNMIALFSQIHRSAPKYSKKEYDPIDPIPLEAKWHVDKLSEKSCENTFAKYDVSKSNETPKYIIKTLLLGSESVGKSALKELLEEKPFREDYEPTIGVELGIIGLTDGKDKYKIQLWDVAGSKKFADLNNTFYRGTSIYIMMFDLRSKNSFDDLDYFVKKTVEFGPNNVRFILVGTKSDLANTSDVPPTRIDAFCKEHDCKYLIISVKNREGINQLIDEIGHCILHPQASDDQGYTVK